MGSSLSTVGRICSIITARIFEVTCPLFDLKPREQRRVYALWSRSAHADYKLE